MPFDPEWGAYVDMRVARGFPLGGMGSGGIALNTDGSFGELRLNNNWMCPIRGVPGSFHAVFVRHPNAAAETVLLRRPPGDDVAYAPAWREYAGVRHVRSTTFLGTLPTFRLQYDDTLPVRVTLEGFTPHVPHDLRASTLPAAVFRIRLENETAEAVEAAVLFAFENVLGRGGTGKLGVELAPDDSLRAVHPAVAYDDVGGNYQVAVERAQRHGIRFCTTQRYDPRSHRAGVTGEYLLLAEPDEHLEITLCDDWNAAAPRASVLEEFSRDGRIASHRHRAGAAGHRPAGAVAARTLLGAHATREIVFVLAWWTPDHVTEPALAGASATAPPAPDGTWVGHAYATYFSDVDAVAAFVLDHRRRLEDDSTAVNRLLGDSSLPPWLVRALANSRDSVLCNTVVPASGRLHTIEGVDWAWPMGGLTGTSDQRLAAHPYLSAFFTDLDLSELDTFRRLAAPSGSIPHGTGNCDLGLGTTDVPYGWPMVIRGFLPAREWTDLTLSLVIQVCTLWRRSGRRDVLERFWPTLTRAMEHLHGRAPHGVPVGGTTFDVWDMPGIFVYNATLYLAALRLMIDSAAHIEPSRAHVYQPRFAACSDVLDDELWDDRGFFRTAPDRATLFSGALAGDWAARYAGADPVLDPVRAASHLRHAHRALVLAAIRDAGGRYRPLPRAEAEPDGTPVRPALAAGLPPDEEMTYVWQVLPYQAMEQMYLGQIHEALQTMQLVYDRLWHDGNAWSGGLRATNESIYMTHPTLWAVLNAFTGAALDVPDRTLVVSPRSAGEIGELRCPFFFPALWGTLDYHPPTGTMEIEIVRTFGEPVTIEHVAHRGASGALRRITIPPTELTEGCAVEVTL